MTADPYRITVVCLGNICRSPMGESVLRDRIGKAGLSGQVVVDSAGTGDWHIGHPADPRAQATLLAAGYDLEHISRQIAPHWMDDIDLLLAMDESNYANLEAMLAASGLPADQRPALRMFRSFDPSLSELPEPHPDLAVPDPYYGGDEGFTDSLSMIEKAADGIVDDLLVQFEQ
ncbi:MAG TPA: protein-tyrosine-phosphatase [Actinobacteria bacterium]|jgi:protein-tyrosine phosphatase|nr:protein-tyrosine-phosphatase [Actinomycetota bacterium]